MPQVFKDWLTGPGSTQGTMSLLPHPAVATANMLWMKGDLPALERLRRLFPIRTGVAIPDVITIDARMESIGAAEIIAVGLWGSDWTWDEKWSAH